MKPYKLLDLYLAFFPFSTTRLVDSQSYSADNNNKPDTEELGFKNYPGNI